jgi:hypothetical protein
MTDIAALAVDQSVDQLIELENFLHRASPASRVAGL